MEFKRVNGMDLGPNIFVLIDRSRLRRRVAGQYTWARPVGQPGFVNLAVGGFTMSRVRRTDLCDTAHERRSGASAHEACEQDNWLEAALSIAASNVAPDSVSRVGPTSAPPKCLSSCALTNESISPRFTPIANASRARVGL